ncbi:MAG: XdhC family protein [Woeseiaceae bacterium]|nr:XdhC family protein [Woeseiaceae bacterium]
MTDWLPELDRLQRGGGTAVLVTVAGVRGSAPREVGASMLVMEAEASGTVGGGELEYQCLKIAARLLGVDADDAGFLRRFPLGPNCGQCCGGVVDVLFERVTTGTRWTRELLGHWRSREAVALDDGSSMRPGARSGNLSPRRALMPANPAPRHVCKRGSCCWRGHRPLASTRRAAHRTSC